MNVLTLAVLLAVMQTPAPVPRQTANPQTSTSQNVAKNSEQNHAPAHKHAPLKAQTETAGNQDQSQTPADSDAQQTIVIRELAPVPKAGKDWWDKSYVLATIGLFIVGAVGVGCAVVTLWAIRAQATVMAEQRSVMEGQLTAMQGQITQMENSGAQTAELIRHAGGQATALAESAQAAKEMAEAARISAMTGENAAAAAAAHARAATANLAAFVHSRRPWISIKTALAGPLIFDEQAARIEINILLENVGQMPAMGVFIHAFFYIEGIPGRPNAVDERKRMCNDSRNTTKIGHVVFPGQPVAERIGISARLIDIEASWTAFWADKVVAEKPRWFGANIIVVVGYGTGIDKDAAYYTGAIYELHRKEPGRDGEIFSLIIETTPLESLQLHLAPVAAIIAE